MSKILQLTPYAPATWASTAFFGLTRPLHLLFLLSEFCPLGVHMASFLLSLSKWGLWLFCLSSHPLLHWPSLSPSCLILLSIFNGHLTVFPIYVCMYVYLFTSTHFRCSCLENPMGRGAWQESHGITRVRHNLVTETAKRQQFIYLYFWLQGSLLLGLGYSSCSTWAP